MANHVQTKGDHSTGAVASLPLAFDGPTTPGNAILVAVSVWQAVDPPAVTVDDNYANEYVPVADIAMTGGTGYRLLVFYSTGIAGGASHTVTITPAFGSQWLTAAAVEYGGPVPSSAFDGGASDEDPASNTPNAGPITKADPGLVFAATLRAAGASDVAPGSGYVERYRQLSSSFNPLVVIDRAAAAAGSHTASWAFTGTATTSVSAILGLKDAAPSAVNLPAIAAYYRRLRGS